MATFTELVNDTLSLLQSFSRHHDRVTYLTASISSSSTTIGVGTTTAISRGGAEIEDEMIWVESVSGSNLVIPPFGRGDMGTTAASHNSGTKVTFQPLFPRYAVKRAINDTIRAVGGDLFGVASTSFTLLPSIATYAMPADTDFVIQAAAELIAPNGTWQRLKRFKLDRMADTTAWPTGKSIDVYDLVMPGSVVKVTYGKEPTELVNSSDVFTTVTGLPESCRDVITYGAAARLLAGFDISSMASNAISADTWDQKRSGGAQDVQRQLYALHRQRLSEEQLRLQQAYPVNVHFTS